ncbi:MAG: AMP phosphorylase [Archaeoglobaceae archaeon]|nr:AMP phosphorylase [Archaeoglobaceae archaeon]MDW8128504.1 AMP phosphorylase [Archaeoglobaceae archaeon]
MKFKVKVVPLRSEKLSVVLNQNDAEDLGLLPGDRVKVVVGKESFVAEADFTEMVEEGEIGVCSFTAEACRLDESCLAEVYPVSRPKSVDFIRKKLDGGKYSALEIKSVIEDISKNVLNDLEISAFTLANEIVGMSDEEIQWMIEAMVENGEKISFERGIVVNIQSIGGLPSNEFHLIAVPLVASAGLLIPKTASRAITSASGTADTMEVLADVNLSIEEIREITEKVGGVIAWGGATNIAPADDRIIRVEHPLSIDPRPQLLASVMAKKGAIGAKNVVIDIPYGEGAKIESGEKARALANDFIELGKRLGLNVVCALTYGGQPIGRAVGPALEAKEALKAMEDRRGSASLLEKSLGIAGILFEMTGVASDGYSYAKKIFESGKTLEKFKEIVSAQGGDEKIRADDIAIGDKTFTITSKFEGAVVAVNNKAIVRIARSAGAPKDKGAGVYIHKKRGEVVKAGDPLLTIYAEKDWKLDNAIEVARAEAPILVSGMILEVYGKFR